ncbi:hypothetical protein Tco_0184338 [Tanacetum coccineum]
MTCNRQRILKVHAQTRLIQTDMKKMEKKSDIQSLLEKARIDISKGRRCCRGISSEQEKTRDNDTDPTISMEEQARFNAKQEARFKAEQEQERIEFETALELQNESWMKEKSSS